MVIGFTGYHFSGRESAKVRESGQGLGDARGVKPLRREAGHVVLEVLPGS